MKTKTLEIRDDGTFIPALAIQLSPSCEADRALLARAGYGLEPERQGEYVLLAKLTGDQCQIQHDPFAWNLRSGRTMFVAHLWLRNEGVFDRLVSGQVVDVEYLLRERETPKAPEAGCGDGLHEQFSADVANDIRGRRL